MEEDVNLNDLIIQNIRKNIHSEKALAEILSENGEALRHIPNKKRTPYLCSIAVDNFPGALKYVEKQNEEILFLKNKIQDLEKQNEEFKTSKPVNKPDPVDKPNVIEINMTRPKSEPEV